MNHRNPLLCCIILCLFTAWLPAAEAVKPEDSRPGRANPHKSVAAQAFYIAWGKNAGDRTFIVIEPGDALRRPVIVATVHPNNHALRVVYAGTAFRDKHGVIHIDCRKSRVLGPESRTWSPDSFSITENGAVQCMDDRQHKPNPGKVIGWSVSNKAMLKNAALADRIYKQMSYSSIRLLARVHLEGIL